MTKWRGGPNNCFFSLSLFLFLFSFLLSAFTTFGSSSPFQLRIAFQLLFSLAARWRRQYQGDAKRRHLPLLKFLQRFVTISFRTCERFLNMFIISFVPWQLFRPDAWQLFEIVKHYFAILRSLRHYWILMQFSEFPCVICTLLNDSFRLWWILWRLPTIILSSLQTCADIWAGYDSMALCSMQMNLAAERKLACLTASSAVFSALSCRTQLL